MSDSDRSQPFGTHDGGEAAELEQLRREAALLREQLQNAAGASGHPVRFSSWRPGSTRWRRATPN